MKALSSYPKFECDNEDVIRDYAYHLYVQSGCLPGRDLDNWLEAKACIGANVPKSECHVRLHRQHRGNPEPPPLNDDDIRDYAYHLYVQNGHCNERCAENWREAIACLRARIPPSHSHCRLHHSNALMNASNQTSGLEFA